MVIPGYQGFVPGNKNGTLLGQRVSEQARNAFKKETIDDKPRVMASTGFNFSKIPKADGTLHAVSHKFGRSTLMDNSDNIRNDEFTTTMRKSFDSPIKLANPNFRKREVGIFDPSLTV